MIHRGPVVIVAGATVAFLIAGSDIWVPTDTLDDQRLTPGQDPARSFAPTSTESESPTESGLARRVDEPQVPLPPSTERHDRVRRTARTRKADEVRSVASASVGKRTPRRADGSLTSDAELDSAVATPAAERELAAPKPRGFRAAHALLGLGPDERVPQPFGVGDPWLFDSPAELEAWTIAWHTDDLHVVQDWVGESPGYARLAVLFTRPNQAAQFAVSFPDERAVDMTGRALRARLRLAAGGGDGGVQVFSQSVGWNWVASSWVDLESVTEWSEITLDLVDSGDYDPTAVVRVGVQVHSGTGSSFDTSEIHLDSFVID